MYAMVSEGEEKSSSTSASDTEMSDDKAKGGYTTRHLKKTTEGIAESEGAEETKT
jgi:hypothetical protein